LDQQGFRAFDMSDRHDWNGKGYQHT
jgi:hypothetical protein